MLRRAAWILVLAGAVPAAAQNSGESQAVLSELWQRRVLTPDKNEASPADLLLLARMRRVEADDAVGTLREKLHGLRGLALLIRDRKTRQTHWGLTKDGFDRYLFLRSQDALAYLQQHDVVYKAAFLAKDLQDAPLFDQEGLLTDAGLTVYGKLLADVPVYYRLPDGAIQGNRAPPKPAAEPEPEVAAPSPRFRHPATQAPPESEPEPAEPQPPAGAPPPAGPDAPQPPSGNGQAAQPDSQRQSASAPPPDVQQAPAPEAGPAPQDGD